MNYLSKSVLFTVSREAVADAVAVVPVGVNNVDVEVETEVGLINVLTIFEMLIC